MQNVAFPRLGRRRSSTRVIDAPVCLFHCHQLRVWIQLNIPRIEDGGNFGVGIQEETLAEVVRCENDAISSLEQVGRIGEGRH